MTIPSLQLFQEARAMIKPHVLQTPIVHSPTLSRRLSGDIYLKLENLQRTGSFKVRGALYKLLKQRDRIGPKGVVAASAGNHAQGVAFAAQMLGVPATIVMPEWASITKQEATIGYGGKLITEGQTIDACVRRAQSLEKDGYMFIHPFDDPDIIAGQGTIALEIMEELADPDMLVAPVGGGGLVSGVAAAAKAIRPEIRIVGAQSAEARSACISFAAGKRKTAPAGASIADGINVGAVGEKTLAIMQACVDDMVTAAEEEIAAAILLLLERKKVLAEGAGAVSLAVLMNGAVRGNGSEKVVLVVSGGNVDSPLLDRIIRKGLIENGRVMRLWVTLPDRPGALARLLALVADTRANVLSIRHDRNYRTVALYFSRVQLDLETRGSAHTDQIVAVLEKKGYSVEQE